MYNESNDDINDFIEQVTQMIGRIREENDRENERMKLRLEKVRKEMVQSNFRQHEANMNRNEYEQLFIECVEEVRKEALMTRLRNFSSTTPRGTSKNDDDHLKRVMVQNNDVLMKTKDQMLPTQKKKILELFMTKDEVLMILYKHLFPQKYDKFQLYNDPGNSDPAAGQISQGVLPRDEQMNKDRKHQLITEITSNRSGEARNLLRGATPGKFNLDDSRNTPSDMTKAVQHILRSRRPKSQTDVKASKAHNKTIM
jgi:hypothetical protein